MKEQKTASGNVTITRAEYDYLLECRVKMDCVRLAYTQNYYDKDKLCAALSVLCRREDNDAE